MNLRIKFIDPTHIHPDTRAECIEYDNDYVWGLFYYPENIQFRQVSRMRKEKYEIHIVKQKKNKPQMIVTLLHELTHYVIAVFLGDNPKLHKILDRNN